MKFLEAKALKMRRDAAANKMLSGPSEDKAATPAHEEPTSESPRKEFDITPAAEDLAMELGIDLAHITGSGPGGRITVPDVRAAAKARTA